MNSSLFWWYWISVSDCWHVSRELNGFRAPSVLNASQFSVLAEALDRRLELTKEYVGTKQTEYEYKHRACLDEIHAIDSVVNSLYGLTQEESDYIITLRSFVRDALLTALSLSENKKQRIDRVKKLVIQHNELFGE